MTASWTASWTARPAPWILRSRRLPPGPVRWTVVQPNAVGSGELRASRGFGQRQLLKGVNQYLAERVVIVANETTVSMWPVLCRRLVGPRIGSWPIDRLLAVPVEPAEERVPADWPAAVLVDLTNGRLLAEVRAVRDDEHTRAVFAALAAD